jgi:hypothetical protein
MNVTFVLLQSTTAKEQVKAGEKQESSKAQASGEVPSSTVVTRPSIFESTKIDEKVSSDPVLSSVRSSLRSRLSAPPEAAAAPSDTKPAPAVGARVKQPVKPLTCVVKITRDGIVKQRLTPVGSQIPKGGQAKQSAPLIITQPAREQAKEQPKELKRPKSIDEIRREKRLKVASGKPVEPEAPKSATTVEQKAEVPKDLIAPAKSAGMTIEIEKQESKLKSKKTHAIDPEKKMEASKAAQELKESKEATTPPAAAVLEEKIPLSTEVVVQDDELLDADLEVLIYIYIYLSIIVLTPLFSPGNIYADLVNQLVCRMKNFASWRRSWNPGIQLQMMRTSTAMRTSRQK